MPSSSAPLQLVQVVGLVHRRSDTLAALGTSLTPARPSRRSAACSDGRVERERRQLGPGAVAARQPGQRAAEPGRELEAVGGAEPDEDLRVVRAAGRRRSRGRRSACTGTSSCAARPNRSPSRLAHERRQPLLHVRVGIERPRVGVDLGTAAVLGRLDGSRVGRTPGSRSSSDRASRSTPGSGPAAGRRQLGGGKYDHLLACAPPSGIAWPSGASSRLVQASAHDDHVPARARAGVGDDVDLAAAPAGSGRAPACSDAGRRRTRRARRCRVAVPRPAGTMPVSGRVDRHHVAVDERAAGERRPPRA